MTPMKITLAPQLMNVILDPIFIFGFWTIKALGVAGAALATSMSELVAAGLYIGTLLKRNLVTVRSILKPPMRNRLVLYSLVALECSCDRLRKILRF